jgi:hypothetical protein
MRVSFLPLLQVASTPFPKTFRGDRGSALSERETAFIDFEDHLLGNLQARNIPRMPAFKKKQLYSNTILLNAHD